MRTIAWLAVAVLVSVNVGCGSSDSAPAEETETETETGGTDRPTASEPAWTKVNAEWTYGETSPGACARGGITVNIDATFTITGCSDPITGTISADDFALVSNRVAPILRQLDRNILCDLQPVADLTWDNRITLATGRTRRVYYSSQYGTCGVGNRTHGEALDALMDALRTKYSNPQPTEI